MDNPAYEPDAMSRKSSKEIEASSFSAVEKTAHILSRKGLNSSSGIANMTSTEWRWPSGLSSTEVAAPGSRSRKRSKQLQEEKVSGIKEMLEMVQMIKWFGRPSPMHHQFPEPYIVQHMKGTQKWTWSFCNAFGHYGEIGL